MYVTVTDGEGGTGHSISTAADFNVKEGGRDHEAGQGGGWPRLPFTSRSSSMTTARASSGVESLRFIRRLYGQGDFALTTVVGQPMKLVDYTANIEALAAGIAKLVARPETREGGQLLSGIYETARDMEARKAARPVIVALTVGGEEHSPLRASQVLDQLRHAGRVCSTSSRSPVRHCEVWWRLATQAICFSQTFICRKCWATVRNSPAASVMRLWPQPDSCRAFNSWASSWPTRTRSPTSCPMASSPIPD